MCSEAVSRRSLVRCLLVAAALGVAVAAAQPAPARQPLVTAVHLGNTPRAEVDLALTRIRAAGATAVRIDLRWSVVAPERPAEPGNPADPAYRWGELDRLVRLARARGLEPIVSFLTAPQWAQAAPSPDAPPDVDLAFGTAYRPDPDQFGLFATAAATRYGGGFRDLPRVRHWFAWNEPNATRYLMPQFIRGRASSPEWYRRLLNRMADAVKGVHRDNLVVAGGLSPFAHRSRGAVSMAPLAFMRRLLCISAAAQPRATCRTKVRFDVWSHHPYTSGGPTHEATRRDDASLGDLGEMRRLLRAAVRHGHVVSRVGPAFWVTEFVWDSRPPDRHPHAVPLRLHARWVAEALYRMWRAGVTLATWHQLRDFPYGTSPFQGGLYYERGPSLRQDRPKPSLVAFRFPFAAFRQGSRVLVWGRTPGGAPGRVIVEQLSGRTWKRRAVLTTDGHGIFTARLSSSARAAAGSLSFLGRALADGLAARPRDQFVAFMTRGKGPFLRARLATGRDASLPFSLAPVKDRYVAPFGGGG